MTHVYDLGNPKLYRIWAGMKHRCNTKDTTRREYKNYAGKGISYCDDWELYENFYSWALASEYEDGLTLDRINPSGDYCPDNCRWLTRKEQNNNKSNNIIVDYQGEEITLGELSERIGIKYYVLYKRYSKGDRGDRLIRPIEKNKQHFKEQGDENNEHTKI